MTPAFPEHLTRTSRAFDRQGDRPHTHLYEEEDLHMKSDMDLLNRRIDKRCYCVGELVTWRPMRDDGDHTAELRDMSRTGVAIATSSERLPAIGDELVVQHRNQRKPTVCRVVRIEKSLTKKTVIGCVRAGCDGLLAAVVMKDALDDLVTKAKARRSNQPETTVRATMPRRRTPVPVPVCLG
jgi:DNA-binding NarL/FixJ family response regulator